MISVVTITFNNYEELIQTLNSIKGISGVESIVINGGKCERTREFLKSYPGISLSEKDYGISDAFNKGLDRANGEAVMFLNSGDLLIDNEYLGWASTIFRDQPEIDFTYSGIIIEDPHLGKTTVTALGAEERSLAKGMPYPHQSLIVRKSVFDRIGHFKINLRFAMDFDLILRMNKLGSKGKYYERATVLMDGTGVSSKNDLKVLRENYNVLKSNGFLTASILLRLSISLALVFVKRTLTCFRLLRILHFLKQNRHKINY